MPSDVRPQLIAPLELTSEEAREMGYRASLSALKRKGSRAIYC
jgi:hypothetical protein